MTTLFAFLTKGPLPHAPIWERWLDQFGEARHRPVVVHTSHPERCPWPYLCLTDPAPTEWAHLGAAHRRIVKEAQTLGVDQLVILSDSCIPFADAHTARTQLQALAGRSSFDVFQSEKKGLARSYSYTKPKEVENRWRHFGKSRSKRRNCLPWLTPKQVLHEQWYILDRRHFTAFDNPNVWTAFADADLEVESYPGTAVVFADGYDNVVLQQTTRVNWFNAVNYHCEHPRTLEKWNARIHPLGAPALFARKYAPGADLSDLLQRIGL